ncbi:hypothetical protein F4819DRAFT_190479 [Hypoxylon fuscum]|nr:hypothetical protein F4819DRAFT_190479 [Hypoxylon fuscum]
MVKSELQSWWRSQTVHQSRLQPTVPICPCAACFNGTGHDQEVFRDPIDPGEVLPLRNDRSTTTTTISAGKPKDEVRCENKLVKKSWYKHAGSLSRKPSSTSMASDMAPLCSESTTQSTQ